MVAPVRILVVDDEEQIAQLLTGALRSDGHEAEYVTDGHAALDRMRENRVDLLVTDLRMPRMGGMELIREAKALHPDLDTLIMTAFASEDTAVGALREGVSDYLSKPFGMEEVREAIEKALTNRATRLEKDQRVNDLSEEVASTREDLHQHVNDLSYLHDLTRQIADRSTPLRECLSLIGRHFDAESVQFIEHGEVVERAGEPPNTVALDLARRTARTRLAKRTEFGMAAPVGAGALVISRRKPFDDRHLRLLSISARDLALAVENDRLHACRRRDYIGIVATLIEAVEAKDRFNRGHSRRVAELASRFAHHVGLPARERELLETAAKLHDIGKIGIPEEILNKPGRLTHSEFDIIKSHPVIGEQILMPLDFLAEARPIVRHHHERWDGGGYPDGLHGSSIPHTAAMLSIVDSFDAMTSTRPYRDGLPRERALSILRDGAGSQWDPALVRSFETL